MNISKYEQRVLHVLAQGGAIHYERAANGKLTDVTCVTRDGHILADCTLKLTQRLIKRGFIKSRNSNPYRATRRGIKATRAQLDNR